MLNIALFGPPGAGKGTQSKKLIEKYNLAYISTGDLLREEIAEGSELGNKAKDIIARGELASDEVIVQIIEKTIRMKTEDVNGFLFDGFPRNYVQAYILEGLLLKLNTSLTCMLSLDVPNDELVSRLMERGKTSGRNDDNMTVIQKRLEEYENKTVPVIDFYKQKDIYFSIDGVGTIDEIFSRLTTTIDKALSKRLLNVVIMGMPGSGRGTQAKKIAEKYNLVYISTGKILRQEEVAMGTELGKVAKPYMDRGEIVPDEIAVKVIEKKIREHPNANGFVFKGFPRTIVQAYILDGLLRRMNSSISTIVELNLSEIRAIKRLSRRSKTDKARYYDMDTDVIIQRFEVYEDKTKPVIDYFKRHKQVSSVDANKNEEEIFDQITTVVDESIRLSN